MPASFVFAKLFTLTRLFSASLTTNGMAGRLYRQGKTGASVAARQRRQQLARSSGAESFAGDNLCPRNIRTIAAAALFPNMIWGKWTITNNTLIWNFNE